MFIPFVVSSPIAGGIGFVAGAFCPAVLRKVKALFVSESKSLEARVSTLEAAAKAKL